MSSNDQNPPQQQPPSSADEPCPFWDCGWCYAPPGLPCNDEEGACNNPQECQTYIWVTEDDDE